MKRFFLVVLVLVCAATVLFAGDFKFLFKDLDQHPELLKGFLPTLVQAGFSYEGLELSHGNLTQLQLSAAGGYTQRAVFQHPDTGEPITENIQVYDVIQARWDFQFLQGLGQSWVPGKDLFTIHGGIQGRYEKAVDSLLLSGGGIPRPSDITRNRGTGGKKAYASFSDWFTSEMGASSTRENSPIYPDFKENGTVTNSFYAGVRLNAMEDTWVANNGVLAELRVQYGPSFMNENASFLGGYLNAVAGKTLYAVENSKGLNLFSVTVLDRVKFAWLDGSAVPVHIQTPYSLGRNIRGIDSNSYNTNFSIVNSLEVRLAGPEPLVHGIFPRFNIFLDAGYGWGNYFNTGHGTVSAVEGRNTLVTAGAQLEVDFFDMIDLGIQASYLIKGTNLRNPDSRLQWGATFFLDF